MQNYDIKKGHWKNIEGDRLVQLIKEIFGNASVKGDAVVTSYKAIKLSLIHISEPTRPY